MLKKLQKYIRKGWLNGWLDEKTETLYLTAEDYRAAQEARAAVQAEPEPKAEPQAEPQETPLNLETTRRFAKVLAQEQQLMQDAQGVEELAHMQKTTEAICDWLEAHPAKPAESTAVRGILYPHHPQAAAHLQRCAGPERR